MEWRGCESADPALQYAYLPTQFITIMVCVIHNNYGQNGFITIMVMCNSLQSMDVSVSTVEGLQRNEKMRKYTKWYAYT